MSEIYRHRDPYHPPGAPVDVPRTAEAIAAEARMQRVIALVRAGDLETILADYAELDAYRRAGDLETILADYRALDAYRRTAGETADV